MSKEVFEQKFHEWLADRVSDFNKALKNGEDPEVTFTITTSLGVPLTMQIRLMDIPGMYKRIEVSSPRS